MDSRAWQALTINSLPDLALLEIFTFYRPLSETRKGKDWTWHILAHVCHQWRQLVLASPERLNIRRYLAPGLPIAEILRCSPPFPLTIDFTHDGPLSEIVPALEHFDRVYLAIIKGTPATLRRLLATVTVPAPNLDALQIVSSDTDIAILPNFLGGEAPALRDLSFHNALFFIRPTSHLTFLEFSLSWFNDADMPLLFRVLNSICLMTGLQTLYLAFWRLCDLSTDVDGVFLNGPRTPLPVLSILHFSGPSELCAAFTRRIDAPVLTMLHVNIVDDPLPIVPSLTQLAVGLMHHLEVHQARVEFSSGMLCVEVFAPSNDHDAEARFCILYNHGTPPLDFLMAATPAVCRSFAPALARVTKLVVQCGDFLTLGEDLLPEIAYTAGWDTILEFFPRATSLSVVCNERLDIVRALQESSDLSPLLPELEKLSFFVKGSSKYNSSAALFAEIQPLLDARGAAERPVKAYTREIPPDGVDAVLSCAPGQPPEIALN